jgi:hypothetical protein
MSMHLHNDGKLGYDEFTHEKNRGRMAEITKPSGEFRPNIGQASPTTAHRPNLLIFRARLMYTGDCFKQGWVQHIQRYIHIAMGG